MSKIGMRFAASLAVICLYTGGVNLIDAQTVTTAESTKNNVYRGVVIDEEGEPLPGVSVKIGRAHV